MIAPICWSPWRGTLAAQSVHNRHDEGDRNQQDLDGARGGRFGEPPIAAAAAVVESLLHHLAMM